MLIARLLGFKPGANRIRRGKTILLLPQRPDGLQRTRNADKRHPERPCTMRAASAKCRVPRSYPAQTSAVPESDMITSTLVRVATPSSCPGAVPETARVRTAAITVVSASDPNCAAERRPSSTSSATRSTARANCAAAAASSRESEVFAGCEGFNGCVFRATRFRQDADCDGSGRTCEGGHDRACARARESIGGSDSGAGSRNPPWNRRD